MSNDNNQEKIKNLINSALSSLGENADSKNISSEKIQNILSDKEATKKILSTPKAQELLKKFLGNK